MTYDIDCPFLGLFAGCCDLNIYALLKFYPNASVLRVGFGFQKRLGHEGCAFVSGISNPHKGLRRGISPLSPYIGIPCTLGSPDSKPALDLDFPDL